MRWYEVYNQYATFKIHSDEIVFKDNFLQSTLHEPLCFFRGKQLVAMIKVWDSVVDITEKEEEHQANVL
jgi:hypothetical protein